MSSRVAGLCDEFVSAFGIQHAAISTLGAPFDVETLGVSDDIAARIDEVQLDLGEGPGWEARASQAPVLVDDLRGPGLGGWPIFRAAMANFPALSVYAFPLTVGSLRIGAVTLFGTRPDALAHDEVGRAVLMSHGAAREVLTDALEQVESGAEPVAMSRRVVHQATGMVLAQLHVSADDALLAIRAHAFATNRPVIEVAGDIVDRRIDFTA